MANGTTGRGGRRKGSGRPKAKSALGININVAITAETAARLDAYLADGRLEQPEATWTRAAFVRAAIQEKLGQEGA